MIIAESKNPNPTEGSSFEKAAHTAKALHYASIWYNREYGQGNWHIPELFLGRRFKHAWRSIRLEHKRSLVGGTPSQEG
jgi:hypothetical protein